MAQMRDTFRPARFFFLDARAGVIILASLIHIRTWTMVLAGIAIVTFYILERKGLSVPSAMRAVRAWLAGDLRQARSRNKLRGYIDYERRPKP